MRTKRRKLYAGKLSFLQNRGGRAPVEQSIRGRKILAFRDIQPQAPVHVLVIPKAHIASANEISHINSGIVAYIFENIPKIARLAGIAESGYRIISNCGEDACQSVPHLHFHILGGGKLAEKMA